IEGACIMAQYILAIDQGTTSTTVVLFDRAAQPLLKVTNDFQQVFPKPGWVEHNPEEIWQTVTKGIQEVLSRTGTNPQDIAAIGMTKQRETTLIWDRETGTPIYNAIVWQCRRTTAECEKLKKNSHARRLVTQKTGLVIDPYFSSTKFQWILDNVKG